MLHAFSWKDEIGYSSNWIEDLKATRKVKHNDFILKNPSPLLVKKLCSLKRKNFLAYLTIKRRSLNHITSSFSKMVSPSDLILSDHVTISLLPFKFCWSSSSTPSFSTKQQMTLWLKQAHKRSYVFLCTYCAFVRFFFSRRFHVKVSNSKWWSCFKGT